MNAEENFFDYLDDITALLHGSSIAPDICIFNPTVVHYQDDLFVWGARLYIANNSKIGCHSDPSLPLPAVSFDKGQGNHTFFLAVSRTIWDGKGSLTHQLLGQLKADFRLEDPHLFKDGKGDIWLVTHNPRGGLITVEPVKVACNHHQTGSPLAGFASGQQLRCEISVGATQILWYLNSLKREKNWVPHNGTARMSYPIYPTFSPHSVFDWGSYERPSIKRTFDYVAPMESFFAMMNNTLKGLIEFAGSTPAVLEDDGQSYIAFGHIRAHPFCYHDPQNLDGPIGMSCQNLAAKEKADSRRHFAYSRGGNTTFWHHCVEYTMFMYRFSAKPPFPITHVSHSFVPCTYYDSGIVYPSGLTRIGPKRDYLIAYGEADRYCRVAILSASKVNEVLRPVADVKPEEVLSYPLCTMPCPRRPPSASRAAAGGGGGGGGKGGGVVPAGGVATGILAKTK